MEYLFSHKRFLKFLWKSEHFPQRHKTKHEWVFISEHVYCLAANSRVTRGAYYVLNRNRNKAKNRTMKTHVLRPKIVKNSP